MSLTDLLSKKKGSENNSKLNKLFSAPAFKIQAVEEDDNDQIFSQNLFDVKMDQSDDEDQLDGEQNQNIIDDSEKQAAQLEKSAKTIFVGNVDISSKKQEIINYFKKYGKIDKIWIRSVPIDEEALKLPVKAAVILKKIKKDSHNFNCYITFSNIESAQKALEANGQQFKNSFLRVDSTDKKDNDYTTTIFVGNLNFKVKEDEIRQHFSQCGEISYIRVVRDQKTSYGKGFCYVKFATPDGYQKGLLMNGKLLNQRGLRIKKGEYLIKIICYQRNQNSHAILKPLKKNHNFFQKKNFLPIAMRILNVSSKSSGNISVPPARLEKKQRKKEELNAKFAQLRKEKKLQEQKEKEDVYSEEENEEPKKKNDKVKKQIKKKNKKNKQNDDKNIFNVKAVQKKK